VLATQRSRPGFADRLLERGVYVSVSPTGRPDGKARIRTQMCAGHSIEQLDRAIEPSSQSAESSAWFS